ncbi:odorant receptor 59b-like [Scaptodrosophila lebanonensis]|uniref:Odorant receptor n=1 Tax=Drosophila lebanonensis TaxID=7225 RepID=A0A6J2U633_DROLE|nr:odorant receptor 59b-like [Scaptodrosophila lebanonensis]
MDMFKLIRPAPVTQHVRSRDAYIYFHRACVVVGWTPPERGIARYLYLIWGFLAVAGGICYCPVGFVIPYFLEFKNFTPGEFLNSLKVCINAYGSSFKASVTLLMLWRLHATEKLLDEMDKRIQNDKERTILHAMVARCNYAFLIYTFIYCSFAGSTFLSYTLSGRPPWYIYMPFVNWRNGLGSLWTQALFEYAVMSTVCLQDQLADVYPLIYTLMLRCHFALLIDRVRNLRKDPNKTEDENFQDLVNCVIDHKMIKRCSAMFRPVISLTIFAQFLLIGIVLGLTLINLFFFSDFWRGVASVMFIVTILTQTFPFCYTCNFLMDDCDDLSKAIFQSNWIDAEPRYKRTLSYFMHNVQQPIVFLAGGTFPINMNTNISVAKFAFSIITIVRQMNLADRFITD